MKLFNLISIIFLLVFFAGCKDSEDVEVNKFKDLEEFNLAVLVSDAAPQRVEIDEYQPVGLVDSVIDVVYEGSDVITQLCEIQTYEWAPGYEELLLLDPATDLIYPGAMFDGKSITTGTYTPLLGSRGPLTFSVSLSNTLDFSATTVDEASLSKVQEGVQELLDSEITDLSPADVSFEIDEMYSSEQLYASLAANFNVPKSSIRASFDFAKSSRKSNFLVKLIQTYYSIDVETPSSISDFYTQRPFVSSDVEFFSPVYVSAIKYGRTALFMVESEDDSASVYAALNAQFSFGVGNTVIDASASEKEILNDATINVLVIGGYSEGVVQEISTSSNLMSYITNAAEYSSTNLGSPMAYTLRYMRDASIVRIIFDSEHDIWTCTEVL